MIKRAYDLEKLVKPNKVLVIYGPRRSGKTTLLGHYLSGTTLKYKLDSGDNIKIQQVLGSSDFDRIKEYASGYELIALDEAQHIPAVGMGLKILVDQIPGLHVIATGSSSFDLSATIGEPLTGRKTTITLYPLAQQEILAASNSYELKERLEEFLIFGCYPEVATTAGRKGKIDLLEEIVGSYLLRDVLALNGVKGSAVLLDLLKLVAFQVGREVSLSELAMKIKLDVKTVGRYVDIFEKAFVLRRVGGLSRNLRKEVARKAKYYFLDNGIRNAVVSQFNPLDSRDDVGALWENFMVTERMKKFACQGLYGTFYFWRTYDGQELDLVEEREGKLLGCEFKWSGKRKPGPPRAWLAAYENAEYRVIDRENYLNFVL